MHRTSKPQSLRASPIAAPETPTVLLETALERKALFDRVARARAAHPTASKARRHEHTHTHTHVGSRLDFSSHFRSSSSISRGPFSHSEACARDNAWSRTRRRKKNNKGWGGGRRCGGELFRYCCAEVRVRAAASGCAVRLSCRQQTADSTGRAPANEPDRQPDGIGRLNASSS